MPGLDQKAAHIYWVSNPEEDLHLLSLCRQSCLSEGGREGASKRVSVRPFLWLSASAQGSRATGRGSISRPDDHLRF